MTSASAREAYSASELIAPSWILRFFCGIELEAREARGALAVSVCVYRELGEALRAHL